MKTILVSIYILIVLGGCKKFLTEDSRSNIATVNFYKNKEELQQAVNGIYAEAYSPFEQNFPIAYLILDEVNGQNINKATHADLVNYNNLIYNNTSPSVSILWKSYYLGIEAANKVLASAENIELSDQDKSVIIGEASFFRAYFYYNLVNIFGDVPMKTTPTASAEDALLPKTPIKDIYTQVIVPDLLTAQAANLPLTPAGNGRLSVGAAKTLLAKVYLSMTGHPVNDATKFALARDKALEVISSGNFSLWQSDGALTWFEKMNNPAFNNTQEVIWDLGFTKGQQNNPYPSEFLPNQRLPPNVLLTETLYQNGGMSPSPAYLNSYDPADLRGKHQLGFWFNQLTINGNLLPFEDWSSNKFFDKTVLKPGSSTVTGLNLHLLRYADLLLLYAEAQNEADGTPNEEAYSAVNGIRLRAGLPVISGLTQDQFRTEVWKQRYWELDLEGWLWFDIVRTQKMFNGTDFVNAIGFVMPTGAIFKQENLKFPIPLSETQINPLLN